MFRIFATFLLGLVGFLAMTVNAGAEDKPKEEIESLISLVNGGDAADRVAASRELFRRGPKIAKELVAAGAKRMTGISPPRLDVIYTVISGLSATERSSEFLGLHFEKQTTPEDVREMGLRYGFRLDSDTMFSSDGAPTSYVHLLQNTNVATLIQELLVHEPTLKTINFNYSEHVGRP
jgi:hypothetical protein